MSNGYTVPAPSDMPGLNLSPEMAKFLREWVEKGVAEAVAKKESEIAKLNEQIVGLSGDNKDKEKKLEAAEKLIDEFTKKTKELSESSTANQELQTRHDAAVRLLDEAIGRLQELGHTRRRLNAAESLLTSSIKRHQTEAVDAEILKVTKGMNENLIKKVRPLLAECHSVAEVKNRAQAINSLVESVPQPRVREPLPRRRSNLSETVQPPKNTEPQDFITSRLLARVS